MSYRELAELCLKILALYWLLIAINNLANHSIVLISVMEDKTQLSKFMFSSTVASMILPIVISLILFFMAKPFSQYIAPSNMENNSISLNIKLNDLHYILLSIFGFILIANSIIPMTKQFITIFTEISKTPDQLFGTKAFLFAYFIQFFMGVWLAFGSKGIVGFIYKLRYSNR